MRKKIILVIMVFIVFIVVFLLGCVSGDREVRIFNANNGNVLRIRNAAPGYTRENIGNSPNQSGDVFATLQNVYNCEGWKNRSTIRVYDTNATLQCTSFIPFPDGIYLGPSEFSVCFGMVVYWNSRFNSSHKWWENAKELCVATLSNENCVKNIKKIPMPSGCSSADWDDQSFVWTSPTSVVVNVDCETSKKFIKKVAIIDTLSGKYRFLPFIIRCEVCAKSSFQGSLSGRYFAFISDKKEVIVCNGLGEVCHIIDKDKLKEFGVDDPPDAMLYNFSTLRWDDDDILWVFKFGGEYIGIDVEAKSIKKHGKIRLGDEECLMGFIQGRYAVTMKRRSSDFLRSILGNKFYIKDIETGDCIMEMPNYISRFSYIGNGLLLFEDL